MLGHVVVRSVRVIAALRHHVPLEQLRPLACRDFIRAYAADLVRALVATDRAALVALIAAISDGLVDFAREREPSSSRPRIAATLGAGGG